MTREEQRGAALKKANEVRIHVAKVKREIRAGERDVIDGIRDPRCANVLLFDILNAQYRFGPTRTARLLRTLAIGGTRTCGQITERQLRLIGMYLSGGRDAAEARGETAVAA